MREYERDLDRLNASAQTILFFFEYFVVSLRETFLSIRYMKDKQQGVKYCEKRNDQLSSFFHRFKKDIVYPLNACCFVLFFIFFHILLQLNTIQCETIMKQSIVNEIVELKVFVAKIFFYFIFYSYFYFYFLKCRQTYNRMSSIGHSHL